MTNENPVSQIKMLRDALIETRSVLTMIMYNCRIDPDLMKSGEWAEKKAWAAIVASEPTPASEPGSYKLARGILSFKPD
jgi:hypothetical protein